MRYLNDEDLEKYADTKVLLEPVEFTGGKMAVLLRTQELSEGYVRLQISTAFQGNGNRPTSCPASRQPCKPLNSKGILGQELLARCKLALNTPLEGFSVGGDGTR